WIARERSLPEGDGFDGIERLGLGAALVHYDYTGAVIVGSELMHYSIDKAAAILGLGSQSVLRVPVDAGNRLDIEALRVCLDDCASRRLRVIAVVGVAG